LETRPGHFQQQRPPIKRYNSFVAGNEAYLEERRFFETVRAALTEYARKQGLESISGSAEIDIPSASLDANGRPRFTMTLPASLIKSDLGAAHVFYDDVAGRGWEFGLRRFLDLHLASDDVFIDVGAHWGIHSLTAATLYPNQVSVLAIEPHPENCARLRRWVERNQLEADVEVISSAIGDHEGPARLWLSGSSMGHSLRTERTEPGSTAIDVSVTTIDQLLADRPQLRWRRFFLKIDVEGYELEALTGAQHLFSTESVAAVIWEKSAFHEPAVQARRDDAIWQFLDSRGFEHFRIEHEHLGGRLLPIEDTDVLCNIFSLLPNFEVRERYG
jgi:FkbM family methyltransferase